MRIEAALFDVFGTVVDWRRGVAKAVRPVLEAEGIALAPEALADAWRAEYEPGMAPIRDGARGYVALDLLHRENLDRALARLGLGARIDRPTREGMTAAWERLPAWPDAVPGIAAMRAERIVAPCSNGSTRLMVRLARFAGLSWDCVLGAEIARSYKPDPAVYLASAAALGLAPQQVAMVAAHNADLAAARALGFRTAFVPRPEEHGAGQRTDLAPEGEWDWVAPDLEALAAEMGR